MGCRGCGSSKRASKKNIDNIKNQIDRVGVFGMRQVKDFVVFAELLEAIGATLDDVKKWVDVENNKDVAENEAADRELRAVVSYMNTKPKCPECDKWLDPLRVNTMACNQVGGKYKYALQCVDSIGCGYESYINVEIHDHLLNIRHQEIEKFKKQRGGQGE